ncbi:MAG: hypothetical protein AAFO29_17095 [Actinomycetota bacterium]
MEVRTERLWAKQNQHEGDRLRLFTAVAETVEAVSVLYPGSFVDVAPSFVFPSVTYADSDRRAALFFADVDGVDEIIATSAIDDRPRSVEFHGGDYRHDLDLDDGRFDLLISLYAGFVSEACTRYLRIGGTLLVNSSHGDAAMASIDERYQLAAVVTSAKGRYRVSSEDLGRYLIPKKPQDLSPETLHELGRGIAYTTAPFAYLFRRVA